MCSRNDGSIQQSNSVLSKSHLQRDLQLHPSRICTWLAAVWMNSVAALLSVSRNSKNKKPLSLSVRGLWPWVCGTACRAPAVKDANAQKVVEDTTVL